MVMLTAAQVPGLIEWLLGSRARWIDMSQPSVDPDAARGAPAERGAEEGSRGFTAVKAAGTCA